MCVCVLVCVCAAVCDSSMCVCVCVCAGVQNIAPQHPQGLCVVTASCVRVWWCAGEYQP